MTAKYFSTNIFLRTSFFLLIVYCSLFLGIAHAATQDDLKFAIDQKARELDEVTKQIQMTQINLTEEAVRSKNLSTEIKRIENTVKSVDLGIKASELTIDKLRLEITSIQNDIAERERSLSLKKGAVEKLLQSYQQRGSGGGFLMLFMSNKTLAESLAEAQSISDLNAGLLDELEQIRQLRLELSQRLEAVADKKNGVEKERQTLQVKKAIVEDQRSERAQLLNETKNRQEAYQKIISELEKKQQSISDEIDNIEDVLRGQYGSSELPMKRPGVLVKPISGGVLSQLYGATKFAQRAYKTKFHNGIDFAVPQGTPVLAADDGIVLMAGNNGRVQYGRYIILKHSNGLATLYAHLSRQSVKTGDTVKRGETIGYSGNTGYSTGAHLHFGVYLGSTVQLKAIGGAGVVPVGLTLDPEEYM